MHVSGSILMLAAALFGKGSSKHSLEVPFQFQFVVVNSY